MVKMTVSSASFSFTPVFHSGSLHRPLLLPRIKPRELSFSFPSFAVQSFGQKTWKVCANNHVFWISEANPVENSSELVSATSEQGLFPTIESTLFFIAFIALLILTLGVIYIAISDFLDKREKEKFEKEEEAANKKKKKKNVKRGRVGVLGSARNGPKGFGQQKYEQQEQEQEQNSS